MNESHTTRTKMKALRFHGYGEPIEVLKMEQVPLPDPGPGRIRIRVYACGLNPADWALCRGLYAGLLPRGVGLDVSGVVDAIGVGVSQVKIGDHVLGIPDFAECTSAGVAEYAIMKEWTLVPPGLDLIHAASLTMAIETAYRSLDNLGVKAGQNVLINGAGTVIGYAAVQMARMRGANVIATAGSTYSAQLKAFGATVTPYGDGLFERVRELGLGTPDLILDTAPPSGALPSLVKIADENPRRVLTVTDMGPAAELGVRTSLGEDMTLRYDVLAKFANLAAEGKFSVPIARTFSLEDWREALKISESGKAHGKLIIIINAQ